MGFINFIIAVANGPYPLATRLAACFVLLTCGLSALIGVAILINGLIHTAKRLHHDAMIRYYRAQRRKEFGL